MACVPRFHPTKSRTNQQVNDGVKQCGNVCRVQSVVSVCVFWWTATIDRRADNTLQPFSHRHYAFSLYLYSYISCVWHIRWILLEHASNWIVRVYINDYYRIHSAIGRNDEQQIQKDMSVCLRIIDIAAAVAKKKKNILTLPERTLLHLRRNDRWSSVHYEFITSPTTTIMKLNEEKFRPNFFEIYIYGGISWKFSYDIHINDWRLVGIAVCLYSSTCPYIAAALADYHWAQCSSMFWPMTCGKSMLLLLLLSPLINRNTCTAHL